MSVVGEETSSQLGQTLTAEMCSTVRLGLLSLNELSNACPTGALDAEHQTSPIRWHPRLITIPPGATGQTGCLCLFAKRSVFDRRPLDARHETSSFQWHPSMNPILVQNGWVPPMAFQISPDIMPKK